MRESAKARKKNGSEKVHEISRKKRTRTRTRTRENKGLLGVRQYHASNAFPMRGTPSSALSPSSSVEADSEIDDCGTFSVSVSFS